MTDRAEQKGVPKTNATLTLHSKIHDSAIFCFFTKASPEDKRYIDYSTKNQFPSHLSFSSISFHRADHVTSPSPVPPLSIQGLHTEPLLCFPPPSHTTSTMTLGSPRLSSASEATPFVPHVRTTRYNWKRTSCHCGCLERQFRSLRTQHIMCVVSLSCSTRR